MKKSLLLAGALLATAMALAAAPTSAQSSASLYASASMDTGQHGAVGSYGMNNIGNKNFGTNIGGMGSVIKIGMAGGKVDYSLATGAPRLHSVGITPTSTIFDVGSAAWRKNLHQAYMLAPPRYTVHKT